MSDAARDLSERARLMWGKYGDGSAGGLALWRHLADSAAVAARLWDDWLPSGLKRRVAEEFPAGEADGRRLVCWLAGIHDIGKASPAFASQVPLLARRIQDSGLVFDAQVRADRAKGPHAMVGQLVLTDWLVRHHGWLRWQTTPFAVVVGGHHGMPPSDAELSNLMGQFHLLGDDAWHAVQDELLAWMSEQAGVVDRLRDWSRVELSQPIQAVLTGIVIVADWIASNEDLFPYRLDGSPQHLRMQRAWAELDLPTPWSPAVPPPDASDHFRARFSMPMGVVPYPVQVEVVEQARSMPLPGLLIVEAPMGEGKTEAALMAAEILAHRSGAGGCFFALPTRATSDALFTRATAWIDKLQDTDRDRGAHAVALAHGRAWLNPDFTRLKWKLPIRPGASDSGPGVAVHRWLAGRKRTMLTTFVVGTIDQLLFAALKSRHVVLRHLGLAGKVVIIDEAHAYDVYMGQYLDRALMWLGAHAVPVIILSATLPARRRAEMMQAYDEGRLGRFAEPGTYDAVGRERGYPLLSVSGAAGLPSVRTCEGSSRRVNVSLEGHDDDPNVLADTLAAALANGGCALVVANTVSRVQETARVLRQLLGENVPVSVAHSRFIGPDRAAKDRWLRDTFGSPRHLAECGRERPDRYVVVASQVAEQSLDIDFDLLVTDLAPVDLVLQRIGRLHRHARERPASLSAPRCLIRGVDWSTTVPEPVGGSVRVYGRAPLLRAAAVLLPFLDGETLALPDDIAPLVQDAYGKAAIGPAEWAEALRDADRHEDLRRHRKRDRASRYLLNPVGPAGRAIIGWLEAGVGDLDRSSGDEAKGRAHVRDDGAESLEVLVLIRLGEQLVTPEWLERNGGRTVPTDTDPGGDLARTVASCSLPLPQAVTSRNIDRIIAELERRSDVPGWQGNPLLAGELVLDLDAQGHTTLGDFDLAYDPDDGLRHRLTS